MQAVTIREAKARLNALIEAAEGGEQVVLMRGSKHVALIVPLTDADLEVSPRLTDAQAGRLWAELAAGQRDGSSVVREGPVQAVGYLARVKRPRASRRKAAHARRQAVNRAWRPLPRRQSARRDRRAAVFDALLALPKRW
jgi:antitoxin (DNA-binding transcriptional repressor) of toxin-antitoxin stability system